MIFHAKNSKHDKNYFNNHTKILLLDFQIADSKYLINNLKSKYNEYELLNILTFVFKLGTLRKDFDFNYSIEGGYFLKETSDIFKLNLKDKDRVDSYLKSISFKFQSFDNDCYFKNDIFCELSLPITTFPISDFLNSFRKYSRSIDLKVESNFVDFIIYYFDLELIDYIFYDCNTIEMFVNKVYNFNSEKIYSNDLNSMINYFSIKELIDDSLIYYFLEFVGNKYSKFNFDVVKNNYIKTIYSIFKKTNIDIDIFDVFVHSMSTPIFHEKLLNIYKIGVSNEFINLRSQKQEELLTKHMKNLILKISSESEIDNEKYIEHMFNSLI